MPQASPSPSLSPKTAPSRTVSADPSLHEECFRGAKFLLRLLEGMGAEVKLCQPVEEKNPLVLARIGRDPAKPTVTFYGERRPEGRGRGWGWGRGLVRWPGVLRSLFKIKWGMVHVTKSAACLKTADWLGSKVGCLSFLGHAQTGMPGES
jgi:hypothetical protein